jgi:UDP-N-acetylglucosamine 2-epimerase (non-hydrolysing)
MTRFGPVLGNPTWLGLWRRDSTVAATLVCSKLLIRSASKPAFAPGPDHAGRINRLVTDQLADVLFTPSADGDENLGKEGFTQQDSSGG